LPSPPDPGLLLLPTGALWFPLEMRGKDVEKSVLELVEGTDLKIKVKTHNTNLTRVVPNQLLQVAIDEASCNKLTDGKL